MATRQLHSSPESTSPTSAGGSKRKRRSPDPDESSHTHPRRKTACQSCRARKVKCDNIRPKCLVCRKSHRECVYIDYISEKLSLDPGTRVVVSRLDEVLESIGQLKSNIKQHAPAHERPPLNSNSHQEDKDALESATYLKVPPCGASADTVLRWECFGDKFPPNCLIGVYFERSGDGTNERLSGALPSPPAQPQASFDSAPHGLELRSLPEERIPSLIDRFLQNVHTKNPILDVDDLVQEARKAAQSVYMMYTFRPLLSWNQFHQASKFYEIYLKTFSGPFGNASSQDFDRLQKLSKKARRIEQSLYWSCFKSEVELRVEFPLEQSTLSDSEYPDMLPCPPSPPATDTAFEDGPQSLPASLRHIVHGSHNVDPETPGTRHFSPVPEDVSAVQRHRHLLYNEEESWYYYLTEIALRRISNSVVNAFYRDKEKWDDIVGMIPTALLFETQISTWAANLPPVMQQFKDGTNLEPSIPSSDHLRYRYSSASQELRILEMKSWLYLPFLWFAIHHGFGALPTEDRSKLGAIVKDGIETNVTILQDRSLLHRHHGIYFDLRAVVTASLVIIAAARSGNIDLNPEIFDSILAADQEEHHGIFGRAFRALRFWEDETLDMRKARHILQDLLEETRRILVGQS
ncbi:MAG: hypothetical protein M1831_003077 [Alyxoria varia]|nr:MAG: hypothetical protein M1831_003077 [Alyxoria varia]